MNHTYVQDKIFYYSMVTVMSEIKACCYNCLSKLFKKKSKADHKRKGKRIKSRKAIKGKKEVGEQVNESRYKDKTHLEIGNRAMRRNSEPIPNISSDMYKKKFPPSLRLVHKKIHKDIQRELDFEDLSWQFFDEKQKLLHNESDRNSCRRASYVNLEQATHITATRVKTGFFSSRQ